MNLLALTPFLIFSGKLTQIFISCLIHFFISDVKVNNNLVWTCLSHTMLWLIQSLTRPHLCIEDKV